MLREVMGVVVPEDMHDILEYSIRNANYERHELGLVRRYIHSGHRVLEGGAGLGYVTRALTGRAEHVVSVEPNEVLYEVASQNAPGAHILCRILSGGSRTFAPKAAHTGDGFGVGTESKGISIPVDVLIDAFHCNALVLDVEGTEADILTTTKRLDSLEVIIVEMHPTMCEQEMLGEAHIRLLDAGFVLKEQIADGELWHCCYLREGGA